MTGSVLAVTINAQGGSYLSFAFPLGLFCVVAAVLYVVLFGRPHQRVPARRAGRVQAVMPDAGTGAGTSAAGATTHEAGAGTSTGAGPQDVPDREQRAGPATEPAAGAEQGNVAGRDGDPAGPDDSAAGTTNGSEASE